MSATAYLAKGRLVHLIDWLLSLLDNSPVERQGG